MILRLPTSALRTRLEQAHTLSVEYGHQLSNHLPMALAALDALGADAQRLDQFTVTYRATHALVEHAPAGRAIPDWTECLGQYDALPELRASLSLLLSQQGAAALLEQALPRLLESPGAAAFHGLIRVAHALESGVEAELVEGLAYWSSRWEPLPEAPLPTAPGIADPAEWLDALDAAWRDEPVSSDAPLIAQRMQKVARGKGWCHQAGRLELTTLSPEALLAALARAATARYMRTRNFTVLHLVTGVRAAAVLHAHRRLDKSSLQRLRDALAAASGASNLWRMPTNEPSKSAVADWDTLARLACAQDDDHVVKLVHALAWWQARDPDPLWRRAAARALQG
jgi:hypothetical protein